MGWDGFMEMERTKLRERSEGKLRRALGIPLPGEAKEQLDRIGADDRRRAQQGLVSMKEGGTISYKHIDDIGPLDMHFIIAAERVEVGWLVQLLRIHLHALRRIRARERAEVLGGLILPSATLASGRGFWQRLSRPLSTRAKTSLLLR